MAKRYPLPKRIIDSHNHVGKDGGIDLIARMDELGIETALVMGTPPALRVSNEAVLKACRRFRGRFIGGAYYDPREGRRAIAALKRYHRLGLRVVKIFPTLGWFPDDPGFIPFFDAVAELKMAVLSHNGWLGPAGVGMAREPWASYYATPGRFEKVARRHPETPFIMAHFGGISGVLEAVMLTTRMPNLYVDCSPGQGLWALERCGQIAGSVPAGKLLWGADDMPSKQSLERYRKALVKCGFGPHLEDVFYRNARGIFEGIGAL